MSVGKFLGGFAIGTVIGAVAGILLAPKSGKENRELICNAVGDFLEKYSPEVCEAKNKAMESLDILKCKLENKYRKVNENIRAKQMAKAKEKEFENYEFN